MKKTSHIFAAISLSAVMLFSGCGTSQNIIFSTGCGKNNVFLIDDLRCPKKEALLYLENYKNLYGKVGTTDLFDGTFDDSVVTENIKSEVLDHLTRVYSLCLYAEENDLKLSDYDKQRVEFAAKEYYSSLSKDEKKFAGITSENDIVSIYTNLKLAEKVYDKLMKSVDSEVSEDEARVVDCYLLYVTDKATADSLKAQLDVGATYDRLLASYSEKDKTLVSFGRGEQSKEVEEAAFNLNDGELSDVVSADGGYYIIKCVSKYDEALSEENKNKILKKRKDKVISDLLSNQHDAYYSEYNDKLWDDITISDEDNVKTDSLFLTLDKAF